MYDDAAFDLNVAGLLLITALVCLGVAAWTATRPYSVTAYLQVQLNFPHSAGKALTPFQLEREAMNALSLSQSDKVINAAILQPEVRAIALSDRIADTNYWFDRIDVSFPNGGQIMALRIDGHGRNRKVDIVVLPAVVHAFARAVEANGRQGASPGGQVRII